MTLLRIALAAMTLGALCAPPAYAEAVVPTRTNLEFQFKVVFLPPQQAFDYCKSLGLWPSVHVRPRKAVGCNLYYPDANRCVVVTPEPLELDDGETLNLGHEVLHCVKGAYHQ